MWLFSADLRSRHHRKSERRGSFLLPTHPKTATTVRTSQPFYFFFISSRSCFIGNSKSCVFSELRELWYGLESSTHGVYLCACLMRTDNRTTG